MKHSPVEIAALLARLADVNTCLQVLHQENIIKQEMIVKGCKKFVNDHPQINEYLGQTGKSMIGEAK